MIEKGKCREPSADGLGFAVADLLPRGGASGAGPPRSGRKAPPPLVEPLPGGGLLAFACAHPPAEVERALMRAFAAELSDRLRPRGAADSKASEWELRCRGWAAGWRRPEAWMRRRRRTPLPCRAAPLCCCPWRGLALTRCAPAVHPTTPQASLLSLLGAAPLHAQPAATPHDAFWAPF